MNQPMSDEQLVEIRAAVEGYRGTSMIRLRPGSAHAHREALLAEVDRLRARLDGLGEEWRFDDGMGKFIVSRLKLSPADVRHLEETTGRKVEHRFVGKWQDATTVDATAAGLTQPETGA